MPGKAKLRISTGQRFNRWTIIRQASPGHNQRRWLCRCDCGTEREVDQVSLTGSYSKSCGCLRSESTRRRSIVRNTTHGESGKTTEYLIWSGIISRCCNPNELAYKNYGGRGIRVCRRWRESYEQFLADVGRRPSPAHTLDRYPNNDGNYEPGNVRWATQKEQCRNTRVNRHLECLGETRLLCEWSEITGLKACTISARIKSGWSIEAAITTPLVPRSESGRRSAEKRWHS